jgi:hypothetical protein
MNTEQKLEDIKKYVEKMGEIWTEQLEKYPDIKDFCEGAITAYKQMSEQIEMLEKIEEEINGSKIKG